MKQIIRLLKGNSQGEVSHRSKAGYRNLTASALVLTAIQVPGLALALDAPCPPGAASIWAPATKDFVGTSASTTSRVYFTGAQGILTEVFYPTLDTVQNVDLQFLVTDANKTWGDEERKQRRHAITQINKRAMVWQAVTTANSNKWKITKKIFTDPGRNSVIQRVTFQTLEAGKAVKDYNVYVLNNPAINNSGAGSGSGNQCSGSQNASQGGDNSRTLTAGGRTMLVASEPNSTSSALAVSLRWKVVSSNPMVSNGFVGQNDGWTDLFAGASDKTMDWRYEGAYGGNVAQIGWLDFGSSTATSITFTVVLAFGNNEAAAMNTANATLGSNVTTLQNTYTNQWVTYTSGLNATADDQYYLAAMTLKSMQDKSNGAMIAGPGTPWGENNGDGNRGGYHLIWARDLFKFASALIAAGDTASANKAVEYLFNVQMQSNGRFPQNSFVNGTPYWNATQMDQTAMPIILAWKLNRVDLWPKIKLAAEFLAHNGPRTEQERWEEMAGYSPSTIAAEVAGLVCAASLANAAGDPDAANFYLQKADAWRNNVANWTFTSTGFLGDGKYYIRINANQDPDDNVELTFGNGAGNRGERLIIDGGFLELVRMGVMSPNDWTILGTLEEYDTVGIIKQSLIGKGDAWFRYNYDGYGEYNNGASYNGSGRGRLWPIFTAERGIYEIARTGNGAAGAPYLSALKAFSSSVGFIPEQIWNISTTLPIDWDTITPPTNVPGTATRSIQPLNWAMGEYINLMVAMNQGHSDAPSVVCQRYACDQSQTNITFRVNATTNWGENVYLVGNNPLLSNWVPASGIKLSPRNYPSWSVTVSLSANTAFEYKYVKCGGPDCNPVSWEGGSNRAFTTPAGGDLIREDIFQ